MTYAVGFLLESGLVFAADSRTNAGVDDISVHRKLTVFDKPGDRVLMLMTSGNLAITQSTVELLRQATNSKKKHAKHLLNVKDMFAAASLIGDAVREVYDRDAEALHEHNEDFRISLIFGGQIKGGPMRLFLIYSAGNFIEASIDSPYFQIGENKYGKPIIDRTITHRSTMMEASKCCLLSFDSTMRSNISVGLPIDLLCYRKDSFKRGFSARIDEKNDYFQSVRHYWSDALLYAFQEMPDPEWKV